MSNGSMEVGWDHHLTSDYQQLLYWVGYLQAVRMIADTVAETRNPSALPHNFDTEHTSHTRLAMFNIFNRRASCSCNGCAGRKREVIERSRIGALRSMRGYRHQGPGIAM
jgi:hypothetical protein